MFYQFFPGDWPIRGLQHQNFRVNSRGILGEAQAGLNLCVSRLELVLKEVKGPTWWDRDSIAVFDTKEFGQIKVKIGSDQH